MELWVFLPLLAVVYFLLYLACRRYSWFSPVLFILIPFLLFPFWLQQGDHPIFYWVKTGSLLVGASYVWALRFCGWHKWKWAFWGVYLILAGNILEAVVEDFQGRSFAHVVNALSGLLVILTVSIPNRPFRVEPRGSRWRDFLWEMPRGWILLYTFWNFTFVYLNFAHSAARMIAVLAVPLLVSFWKRGTWMQARFMTLAFHMMAIFTFPALETTGSVSHWYVDSVAQSLALLSLLGAVGYTLWLVREKQGIPLFAHPQPR